MKEFLKNDSINNVEIYHRFNMWVEMQGEIFEDAVYVVKCLKYLMDFKNKGSLSISKEDKDLVKAAVDGINWFKDKHKDCYEFSKMVFKEWNGDKIEKDYYNYVEDLKERSAIYYIRYCYFLDKHTLGCEKITLVSMFEDIRETVDELLKSLNEGLQTAIKGLFKGIPEKVHTEKLRYFLSDVILEKKEFKMNNASEKTYSGIFVPYNLGYYYGPEEQDDKYIDFRKYLDFLCVMISNGFLLKDEDKECLEDIDIAGKINDLKTKIIIYSRLINHGINLSSPQYTLYALMSNSLCEIMYKGASFKYVWNRMPKKLTLIRNESSNTLKRQPFSTDEINQIIDGNVSHTIIKHLINEEKIHSGLSPKTGEKDCFLYSYSTNYPLDIYKYGQLYYGDQQKYVDARVKFCIIKDAEVNIIQFVEGGKKKTESFLEFVINNMMGRKLPVNKNPNPFDFITEKYSTDLLGDIMPGRYDYLDDEKKAQRIYYKNLGIQFEGREKKWIPTKKSAIMDDEIVGTIDFAGKRKDYEFNEQEFVSVLLRACSEKITKEIEKTRKTLKDALIIRNPEYIYDDCDYNSMKIKNDANVKLNEVDFSKCKVFEDFLNKYLNKVLNDEKYDPVWGVSNLNKIPTVAAYIYKGANSVFKIHYGLDKFRKNHEVELNNGILVENELYSTYIQFNNNNYTIKQQIINDMVDCLKPYQNNQVENRVKEFIDEILQNSQKFKIMIRYKYSNNPLKIELAKDLFWGVFGKEGK